LLIGIFLSFIALTEILHLYSILYGISPYLGLAFLCITVAILLLGLLYIFIYIRKKPKVLTPPQIEDFSSASQVEWEAYFIYLTKYQERLLKNPSLSTGEIDTAFKKIKELEAFYRSDNQQDKQQQHIFNTEKEVIEPLLAKLDEKAEKEVRKCVRDIMIGVTLSPYRTADLFIVIYRNCIMMLRIMKIYQSRPVLAEQLLIFRDVLKVVATVNYMNFGEKLMEQFLSCVPYIGRSVDDFAQGIGAGLLTSTAGHGTIQRCRAYKRWDHDAATHTLSTRVKSLFFDVKNIFKRDVLPRMRNRVYSTAQTDQRNETNFWEKTTKNLTTAVDTLDSFIDNVVLAGTKGGVKASSEIVSRSGEIAVYSMKEIWNGSKTISTKTMGSVNNIMQKTQSISMSSGKSIKKVFYGRFLKRQA